MLLLSAPLSLGRLSYLDSARKYLYVREIKPNRSKEIDKWNNLVGAPLGSSYCAAFVGSMLKLNNIDNPRASALARNYYTNGYKRFTAGDVLLGRVQIKEGDIIVWARGNTINGHVGFANKDWIKDKGETIEANTSSGAKGSQYNGDGVFIRQRKIEPYSFFRIIGGSKVGN